MKKYILLIAFAVTATFAAMAQPGGNFQRRTPEERLKPIHEKIDSAFKLEAAKLKQVDEVFLESFKEQDKKMEEIRASGTMDREVMMAARQELMDARDKKLKAILTEEQMKIFKDQIEPSLRPQRGGGRN
jgi:periplasmic protein CpxP/Spy